MSRVIDTSKPDELSDEDIKYLQERDRLPEGVKPVLEPGLVQMGLPENTGQVMTHEVNGGQPIADPPQPSRSSEYEPVSEGLSADDYETATVAELKAEVDRRNEQRGDEDQLSKPSKKAELIDVLKDDDDSTIEED